MTALDFQKDLATEVENILKDVITYDPDGQLKSGVTAYRQFLPKVTEDDEDETKFFPYAIIRLSEGTTPNDFEPWEVTADILLGVYDVDPMMGGNDNILIMIRRIIDRFSSEALLSKRYRCQSQMDWAVQDEDTYPYFFGGVRLKFSIPKIGRSEPIYE